ncbi:MAG: hypothetical protein IH984_09880 [Planctomycetes bacterium]|nr:hypothetical protein [Planctomycetota bacterium]
MKHFRLPIQLNILRAIAPVCIATTLLVVGNAQAQCDLEKLLASDAAQGDNFSRSVAIDGVRMIVGAPGHDGNGSSSGAAYIYKRQGNNWIEETKLLAADSEGFDKFGYSVDISGDFAIVGAYHNDQGGYNAGAAYIFRYDEDLDEWVQQLQQKLLAPDSHTGAEFGASVAIKNNLAIIGAPKQLHGTVSTGAAYAFQFSDDDAATWNFRAKLIATTGFSGDLFGWSVDIDGDHILVGAIGAFVYGPDSGAAYVFQEHVNEFEFFWLEQSMLAPSDGEEDDWFGVSVAISGDKLVVGAVFDDILSLSGGVHAGSAYVFHYDANSEQWIEQAKLVAFDGTAHDHFGRVAIEDDIIIVGAPDHDLPVDNGGGAYAYQYIAESNSWIYHGKLIAPNISWGDDFGARVDICNGIGIVSAPRHDEPENSAGAAFVFDVLANQDNNANGVIDACEIGFADLNADGVVDLSDLIILLGFWGPCPNPPIECQADLFSDGIVNTQDLLILFASWR